MKAEQIGIGIYGECRHFGKGKKKDEGNEGFMRFDACCAGIVRMRRGKEKRGGGETVLKFDADGKLVPWLADFDGKVFTVKNVKFTDGSKVTAKDICDSLTDSCAKNVRAREVMKNSSWKVLTDNTFEYIGEKSVLTDPVFCIVKGGNVYTGGKVISYSAEKAVVERNDRKYEYLAIGHNATRGMAIETGDVDVVFDVDPQYYKGREHEEVGGARTIMSRMNMASGRPLSNPKLRKILAECINLQDMEKPLRGYVVCNPNYSRYTKSNRIYNPVKADKPVTLKMVFYESRPEFKIIAEATQLQAKKAGIDIKLQSVHVNALRDVEVSGDYDLVLSSTTNIQSGTVENYYRLYFDSKSPENHTRYNNPAFDNAKTLQEQSCFRQCKNPAGDAGHPRQRLCGHRVWQPAAQPCKQEKVSEVESAGLLL